MNKTLRKQYTFVSQRSTSLINLSFSFIFVILIQNCKARRAHRTPHGKQLVSYSLLNSFFVCILPSESAQVYLTGLVRRISVSEFFVFFLHVCFTRLWSIYFMGHWWPHRDVFQRTWIRFTLAIDNYLHKIRNIFSRKPKLQKEERRVLAFRWLFVSVSSI